MSTVAATGPVDLRSWQLPALGVGGAASVVCVLGALLSPAQFFRAYLAAYIFFLGLGLGCMAILMVYYLTGGAWGFLSRRILEAGMRTLPLLAVLFVPVACGVGYLYPWAQPALVAADPRLQRQQIYLNAPFFCVRAGLFFVLWLAFAYFLGSWSDAQDRTGDERLQSRCGSLSGAGLVVYGISLHFAAVDWVMSLQPMFHSTIFGPLLATGQIVSAMSLVIVVVSCLALRPPLDAVVSAKVLTDLGSLLFAFLIIWAYMAWFQFMLIWIANLPVDVVWYAGRLQGGWLWVTWALVVLHFAVPFFLLLLRMVKETPRIMVCLGGLILGMQLVFDYWQVLPAFLAPRLVEHWLDFVTPLALGGLWLAFFLWQLGRRPLLPAHDSNWNETVHLRNVDEREQALEETLSHA
jgi:hypothetical protein